MDNRKYANWKKNEAVTKKKKTRTNESKESIVLQWKQVKPAVFLYMCVFILWEKQGPFTVSDTLFTSYLLCTNIDECKQIGMNKWADWWHFFFSVKLAFLWNFRFNFCFSGSSYIKVLIVKQIFFLLHIGWTRSVNYDEIPFPFFPVNQNTMVNEIFVYNYIWVM